MANYWLFKCEPDSYSIDDLKRDGWTFWNGVRNYQARNFLRDEIKQGDLVLYYHSNADPSGVAGIAKVKKSGYGDHTALDPKSTYFDEKATKDDPIWYMVDVAFVKKFKTFIPLEELKRTPGLEKMMVVKKGSRLSVQPVTEKEFKIVEKMGG